MLSSEAAAFRRGELARHDQQADRDQHGAAEADDQREVAAEERERARHVLEAERDRQERDREPRGVEREQQRAVRPPSSTPRPA